MGKTEKEKDKTIDNQAVTSSSATSSGSNASSTGVLSLVRFNEVENTWKYSSLGRPRTRIGIQGEHVSAYALFKECAFIQLENYPDNPILALLKLIDSYAKSGDTQEIFEKVKTFFNNNKFATEEDIKFVSESMKAKGAKEENIQKIISILEYKKISLFEEVIEYLIKAL